MKINRPYLIALLMLLALGLLFMWSASSLGDQSLVAASSSCEEVDESIEEDARGHFVSFSLCYPAISEVETACFMQYGHTRESSVFACSASHPSGWMMPLRI